MEHSISILDKDYSRWISELSSRYRRSQIKAAVKAYTEIVPQLGEHFTQQVAEQINLELFSVPWGHHMLLIDKCKGNPKKALGISEYELAKLYPEKVEGTIPTIEELEQKLGDRIKNDKD
ncbi:MAG: hypothetical protein II859_01075 [Bacteroidales bacterium]|jgi:hypothetical protein|nr:hypothetical protein [Bacteroidales bacterium]